MKKKNAIFLKLSLILIERNQVARQDTLNIKFIRDVFHSFRFNSFDARFV